MVGSKKKIYIYIHIHICVDIYIYMCVCNYRVLWGSGLVAPVIMLGLMAVRVSMKSFWLPSIHDALIDSLLQALGSQASHLMSKSFTKKET